MSSTCSAVLPTQPLGATAEERQEAEEVEDRLASPASLWLPRTVVKRHRIKATIIWVSLILAFLAYIAYIVWDAVESRMDPATSFELKRELFTFPDISVCVSPYEGCLNIDPSACFENASFVMFSQWGFMEDELEADEASLAIEEAYPHCKVLPTSKLTVNQTGVDNGDINYFFATFGLLWDEDPYDDFDPAVELATTGRTIYTQFVNLFFVDVDLGVEAIGEELTDAKLPYDRLSPNTSGLMAATTSHMVIQLTQFQPISTSSGEKQEPQRTFTQSSTSTTVNWYNPDFDEELAALMFNMFIPKFEYTSIEQVDPVDGWAIIGAIGGVWQFVVIAFGLFFVFSEKQLPDKKIRNFKKSVAKPASIVTRHLSSASSRDPTIQDIEIDTSNEDLPIGWVKRQRKDGTTYYYNPLTGDARENSPNEAHAVVAVGVAPTAKRRSIARALRAAHNPGTSASSSANRTSGGSSNEPGDDELPPGWVERADASGKYYYVNTLKKTTQWDRPHLRSAPPTGGGDGGVEVIDAPMHRSAKSSFDLNSKSNINISINSNIDSGSGGGGSGGIASASDPGSTAQAPPSRQSPPEGSGYSDSATETTQDRQRG